MMDEIRQDQILDKIQNLEINLAEDARMHEDLGDTSSRAGTEQGRG